MTRVNETEISMGEGFKDLSYSVISLRIRARRGNRCIQI